jgi:hypothetical protein
MRHRGLATTGTAREKAINHRITVNATANDPVLQRERGSVAPSPAADGQKAAGPVQRGSSGGEFFRRWVWWTVAGEAVGFGVAAGTGAIVATQGIGGWLAFALMLGAGATEGALLGTGQAVAMRRLRLPSRTVRRWPLVTSAAAVVAWSIGMLPSSVPNIPWSNPVTWVAAAVLGSVLLLSIPTAQFLVLRTSLRTAWRWIPANVLGWALGVAWTIAPSPLVDASTPIVVLILLYATAGVLMAITVAAITGLCWLGWLRSGAARVIAV